MNKIENIILGVLFMAGEGVELEFIAQKLEVERAEISKAIKSLKSRFGGESGIHLITFNDKVQLATNPEYALEIATVLNPIKERQLSKTALEVAAIIAYKQPVTRLEIEEIRGVNSDYALQLLLKHSLITVVGRKDSIGKPLLFGTTDEFLKRFELSTIGELPDYEDLISRIRQIRESQNQDDSLYNNFEIPEEESKVTQVTAEDEILPESAEN